MHNFVLCGMQFGDEGKGTFVDFLAHKYDANWIIRYNGGSQASHTVITPRKKLHKFSQLGSGMFNDTTKTFLSSNMVINLDNLFREVECFCKTSGQSYEDVLKRLYVSRDCFVVTPYHKLLNQLRELSLGKNRRGSVGTGVSEVSYLNWYAKHKNKGKYSYFMGISLYNIFYDGEELVRHKLKSIRDYVSDFYTIHKTTIDANCPEELKENLQKQINYLLTGNTYTVIAKEFCDKADDLFKRYPFMNENFYNLKPFIYELVNNTDNSNVSRYEKELFFKNYTIIYEGSQGLLLDVKYGLKPNTTLLDTTANHAMRIIYRIKKKHHEMLTRGLIDVHKIGVAKAFYSRHGKGVFPTENYKMNLSIKDENQENTFWNGEIRFGWFDTVLFRYAQRINRVKEVYLSSVDILEGMGRLKICSSYRYKGIVDEEFGKLFDYYINYQKEVIITDIKCTSKNISKYLEEVVPIYIEVEGFTQTIVKDENGKKCLSPGCANYIRTISHMIHLPITLISYGPTRKEKFFVNN